MKRTFLMIMASMILALGGKELRQLVLTPTPQMQCENCEKKIKKKETDREKQHVTITYDPAKNNVEGLQKGMKKIGYDTKVVSDKSV